LGLRDKFVVMYSGNAGIVHDFDAICAAMRALKNDPRIQFLFVGNGPRRAEIEAFARDKEIGNFQYRDYFTREQLRYSLSVADVHLISLRASFVGISVPGKLYGIMASARPALFVGPRACESAETILEAACGAVIDPADGDGSAQLVNHICALAENINIAEAMGAAGRAAFERKFERQVNCEIFGDVIARAWRAKRVPVLHTTAAPADAVFARRTS
jgi:glycosyltransferase involved in cell wall biosynthesis